MIGLIIRVVIFTLRKKSLKITRHTIIEVNGEKNFSRNLSNPHFRMKSGNPAKNKKSLSVIKSANLSLITFDSILLTIKILSGFILKDFSDVLIKAYETM